MSPHFQASPSQRLTRLALVAALLVPGAAYGVGYKVEVEAPKGWADGIEHLAVVVTQSHEALNPEDLRKQISNQLLDQAKKLPFEPIPDRLVADAAGWDWSDATPEDLRAKVFDKTKADAILEVQAPFASSGKFGIRGSEVRVRVRVVAGDGTTKMSGDCSAQAFNTASSPENIARHCALRLLGDALGRNLD